MRVFLAQTKPTLGNVEKNLNQMITIIKDQIGKSDIVVFPELSLTGYLLEEMVFDVAIESVPKELLELSREISIIFGAVELGKDMFHYNSAFYLEDGEIKHIHRKVYPPTYGLFDERRYFKAGEKIEAFNTKFGRVGILICEDVFHQSSTYILGQDGAEVVFIIANSPARLSSKGLGIKNGWDAICSSAALTNSYFVIRVNRVGIEDGVSFWGGSAVFSPSGEKLVELQEFEEGWGIEKIDRKEIIKERFSSNSIKDENVSLVLKELKRIEKVKN